MRKIRGQGCWYHVKVHEGSNKGVLFWSFYGRVTYNNAWWKFNPGCCYLYHMASGTVREYYQARARSLVFRIYQPRDDEIVWSDFIESSLIIFLLWTMLPSPLLACQPHIPSCNYWFLIGHERWVLRQKSFTKTSIFYQVSLLVSLSMPVLRQYS